MFGTIVLVIATLFFLYTAWSSGIAPVEFAERFGLTVANAGGYNEIRAQYAGFFSQPRLLVWHRLQALCGDRQRLLFSRSPLVDCWRAGL